MALRIGRSAGARVELLRVVRPEVDVEEEEAELLETVDDIAGAEGGRVSVHIRRHDSVIDGIGEQLDDGRHDLVVIGASRDSRIRQVLFGSIPDKVAARADCSVLMVRRYLPDHWTVRTSEAMKRLRERAGMTTSPEG